MQDAFEEKIDKLYARVRLSFVARQPHQAQRELLQRAYGDWEKTGVLPSDPRAAQGILVQYDLPRNADPVTAEEYRRLENALDYRRKVFCLDMDGLLVEDKACVPGMRDALARIRERHACVVTTAAPEAEAQSLLEHCGLGGMAVFGNLDDVRGKNYRPVAEHFGYAWPEKRLVAVSHSMQDIPADIRIPFLHLNAPTNMLAGALLAAAASIDGAQTPGFIQVDHQGYRELRQE